MSGEIRGYGSWRIKVSGEMGVRKLEDKGEWRD